MQIESTECTICLEKIDDTNNKHTMDCGHIFHTSCILVNAQKGNINCPLCRELPHHVINFYDARDERDNQINDYNRTQLQSHFLKGLAMVRNNNTNKDLRSAVKKYYQKIDKHKKQNKKRVEENKIARQMNADIKKMMNIKKKEAIAELKIIQSSYMNTYNIKHVPKVRHKCCRRQSHLFMRCRTRIANLVGYRHVEY